MVKSLSSEDDWEYCFKCCTEYGTSETCPDCDCFYIEFLDDELWEEEEEEF